MTYIENAVIDKEVFNAPAYIDEITKEITSLIKRLGDIDISRDRSEDEIDDATWAKMREYSSLSDKLRHEFDALEGIVEAISDFERSF